LFKNITILFIPLEFRFLVNTLLPIISIKLEPTFEGMTSKALKKKVIEYINHADDNVIEAVYKMLKIYEDSDGKSLMTSEQKSEIERRSALYKLGKVKSSSWEEVKKRSRTA